LAFNTGSSAVELEKKSDDEIIDEVTCVLRHLYNDQYVPEPANFIRTKWAMDPLSGGSYSFIPINSSLDDFDELAKPVNDKLFFAGEATNKYYYATVHGAYISGYQAAEKILQLENKFVDSERQQLEHGIKSWDVICSNGQVLVEETSADTVKCKSIQQPIENDARQEP
jgi:hypothetical protein